MRTGVSSEQGIGLNDPRGPAYLKLFHDFMER